MIRLIFAALMAFLFAVPASAEPLTEPVRSVSVSASGEIETTPNRAVLPVEVHKEHKSLATAKQENDKLTATLLKIAKEYGIPEKKIKTSGMNIAPQYRWDKGKQFFEHYVVSRSLQITIDDLDKVERLIAAFTEAGVDRIHGVQFTLADPEKLEGEARVRAMQNAHRKAEELAQAAGVKLGKVISISLDGASYTPPPMPMRKMMMAEAAVAADQAALPPTLPGITKVEQHVNVTYALE